MSLSITHAKTNNIADWTQADLNAQIGLGNYPPGTLLADIPLPSDWNHTHTVTGNFDDAYLKQDGTTPLTADWNAGAFKITAANFVSNVATGTKPYACSSITLNDNLNADYLNGVHGKWTSLGNTNVILYSLADNALVNLANPSKFTYVLQNIAGVTQWVIQAATATPSWTQVLAVNRTSAGVNPILSTTDHLEFRDANKYIYSDAATSLTIVSDGTITLSPTTTTNTAKQIVSSLATGTSPFSITSTTVNTNLNADKVDGIDVGTMTANKVLYTNASSILSGAMMTYNTALASRTPVLNLAPSSSSIGALALTGTASDTTSDTEGIFFSMAHNAGGNRQLQIFNTDAAGTDPSFRIYFVGGGMGIDSVSANGATRLDFTLGTNTTSVFFSNGAASFNSSGQLVSTIATGTAPLVVSSTTLNTNFNADKWDGVDLVTSVSTGQVLVGTGASQVSGLATPAKGTYNLQYSGGAVSWGLLATTTWASALAGGRFSSGNNPQLTTTDHFEIRDSSNYIGSSGSNIIDIVGSGIINLTALSATKAGGASGTTAKIGGNIFDHFTDSTVGGAEADIYTDTLAANIFNVNGDKVTAEYGGNFVTVGTELTQLKVYFAGTAIWDSTGVAPTTGTTSWRVYAELIRVSSTVVRYSVSLNTTGASGFVYCTVGELTGLTLSGTNILKITGTSTGVGSGSGDIVGKMSYGQWKSAA